MDYNELVEKLNNLEARAYGYNIHGEVFGMDCSDFEQIMVDATTAITELLARAEKAERQRDEAMADLEATRAALAEAHGFVGVTAKTMFGVPLARLHQLAEADKAGSILGALDMAKVACALHELSKYKELGDLDRLRELVQADREGRCEIHAAKDGDTVYSIFAYVNGLHIRKSNGKPITKITSYVVNDFTRNTVDREFMKTVFPTIESAEQALKEVEKDG